MPSFVCGFALSLMLLVISMSRRCCVLGFQTTSSSPLSSQRQNLANYHCRRTGRLLAVELENDVKTITPASPTEAATKTSTRLAMASTVASPGVIDDGYSFNNDKTTATNRIPKTMSEALEVFFLSPDYGPLMVVASIFAFTLTRITGPVPITINDVCVFVSSILFWSVQEHWIHDKLLHSKFNWVGKQIHIEHHQKPYYHISIDPASLLLGWMLVAHIIFKLILPIPLALSATIGYAMAGLFYEWAHFLVHTRVKFTHGSFWKLVKDNHVRHHLVNSNYWFSFSLPWIDDLFGTNPPVRQVQKMTMEEQ